MKSKNKLFERVMCLCLSLILVCCLFSTIAEAASKGYVFKYKSVRVTMNGEAAKVIKKAGKPISKTESKSCAFKGLDRTYTYKDFKLTTYSNSKKGTEYVNGIELLTSNVSTSEGIKIGSTKNKMIKAYGKAEAEFGVYTYEKGKSKLIFEVEDNKVVVIKYLAK